MLLGRQGGDGGTGHHTVMETARETVTRGPLLQAQVHQERGVGGATKVIAFEKADLGQKWVRGQLKENAGQVRTRGWWRPCSFWRLSVNSREESRSWWREGYREWVWGFTAVRINTVLCRHVAGVVS